MLKIMARHYIFSEDGGEVLSSPENIFINPRYIKVIEKVCPIKYAGDGLDHYYRITIDGVSKYYFIDDLTEINKCLKS